MNKFLSEYEEAIMECIFMPAMILIVFSLGTILFVPVGWYIECQATYCKVGAVSFGAYIYIVFIIIAISSSIDRK